jgi:type VI secretion system secreted protein Hcp
MPIYMKVDGIDGSTTAHAFDGWITVDTVQWGSSRPISTSGEVSGRAKSALSMSEVIVGKKADKSSGPLWQEHLKAATSDGKTVEFQWLVTTSTGQLRAFQKMKLENALISSFNTSSTSTDRANEMISFNFTKIECTYLDMEQAGTATSKPFVASYNLSTG